METIEALIHRRSCRKYKADAVPAELIDAVVEAVHSLGVSSGASGAFEFMRCVADSGATAQFENVKKSKAWRLLRNPQSADGQLAAIGYANQLASNQSNQLLQIRSLLITQQNAVASQMQAEADREAQYQASRERLFDMGSPTDRSKNKGF